MSIGHLQDAKSEFESALGVCSALPRPMAPECVPTVKLMENVAECYKREGNTERQERCLRLISETIQRDEPDVYLRARAFVELARVQIERFTADAATSEKLIESIKGLRSRNKDPRATTLLPEACRLLALQPREPRRILGKRRLEDVFVPG